MYVVAYGTRPHVVACLLVGVAIEQLLQPLPSLAGSNSDPLLPDPRYRDGQGVQGARLDEQFATR